LLLLRIMTDNNHPLSKAEFDAIYAKVPRLTVEIIVKNDEGAIFLTKRAAEPCKGKWHIPGGTVQFGEPMIEAVKRIAKRELGITVEQTKNQGYIEYPSHYKHGLDSPVGIVFEVTQYSGDLTTNQESEASAWFTAIPSDMHADQDIFLLDHGYLT
jgi:ADP-ribose pyrophosphatase YjhB (NUDIX family)